MGKINVVQTSTQPVQVKDQTHFLTRSDGETTVHAAVFHGNYGAQDLQVSVLLMDERPGLVYVNERTRAFSCFGALTPEEAELWGQALLNGARAAREIGHKQLQVAHEAAKAAHDAGQGVLV